MLIDPGLELSFISSALVDLLKIPRPHSSLPIMGIGALKTTQTHGKVVVTLKSAHRNIQLKFHAHVLSKLTSSLPSQSCDESAWPHINKL